MKYLFILLISLFSVTCHAAQSNYQLDLRFNTGTHSMEGTAEILFPAEQPWTLDIGRLQVEQISVQEKGKKAFELPIPKGSTISMYGGSLPQHVTIRYTMETGAMDFNNRISSDGIVLTSGWHPVPDHKMNFSLEARLPPGFKGISESDVIDLRQDSSTLKTSFSQATRTIHLAAGPYRILDEKIHDHLSISVWFFAEEEHLSKGYLEATKSYIVRYEKEIGPFPYPHYAVVANRLPTGYGMPTFTLLGQMLLKLPFIKNISLGHEVVHSWFGNNIEVMEDSGNWCEALTSYLADFSFASDLGEGAEHRKDALINYQSYVHQDSAIPVESFMSASHNQPMAKAIRAVGYNRGAMLFHQLRKLLGDEVFNKGIQNFASTMQGKSAGWMDIKNSFESVSELDLAPFFIENLTRSDSPTLEISNITTESQQDSTLLSFTILQKNTQPYTMQVPIRVTTIYGEQDFIRTIDQSETRISLSLADPPLSFSLDPEYDLFRNLDLSEFPPVWSRFMGSSEPLIVHSDDENSKVAPFINWAEQQGWPIVEPEDVTNQQLASGSILFTSDKSLPYRSIFGNSTTDETGPGFHLSTRQNPLNSKEVVVLIRSSSEEETGAVLRKLDHYGKYASLSFSRGSIKDKSRPASENGLSFYLEDMPLGGSTEAFRSFDKIIKDLADNQVIYLGETHTSLADHILQFRIIQALHKRGLNLAVAMEMFPTSSQGALDEYVLSKDTDETQFLMDSRWFDVWRYDWRLFRPMFNFCRDKKIPVFGINIDRKIVSTVFDHGNTDELSNEQVESIADDRDLGIEGYVERLQMVHAVHAGSPHGKNKGISGFVQSQAIWDESMAENIVDIIKEKSDRTVVVIAGSQHTRKDSGIPPRVARRMEIKQASVINLYGQNSPVEPEKEADYFFMTAAGSLEPQGKIGVILITEKDEDGDEYLRISDLSHAGKAKEAGIQKDDILVSINSRPVHNMEDIGLLMMDSKAGDTLPLAISRTGENGENEEIQLTVELSDLSKPFGHP